MGERLSTLALTFPTLRHAEGVRPWNPELLDEWAAVRGGGARHSAAFVLGVWNDAGGWQCGRFDAISALASWDSEHRSAFVTWATQPWWG